MSNLDPDTIHFLAWFMRHGYHCWSELHPYFADHSKGAWREWLCGKGSR